MKVWWLRLGHYAKPHTASFGVDAAHDLRSGLSDADALAHETHCRLRADKSAVAAKRCVDQRFARRRLTAGPTDNVYSDVAFKCFAFMDYPVCRFAVAACHEALHTLHHRERLPAATA